MEYKPLKAAWQQLPSPQVTVAMASLGFDWIVVDLEHASITTQEAEAIFIAAEQCGCKPFARLPSADPYLARRLLDAGVQGLIVPVVEEKDSFDAFGSHCFFPPQGRRGLGLVRANLWGEKLDSYFSHFKPILIGQIETLKGANNIEAIVQSKYIDGIMIGPYDLSASLGKPGQFQTPEFSKLVGNIHTMAKQNQKMMGFHQVTPDPSELQKRKNEGYDFIAYATDVVALRHALKDIKLA